MKKTPEGKLVQIHPLITLKIIAMNLKDFQALFTGLAIIATAGFFGWKIIAGWLIVNLEIAIETSRQFKDETNDWLGINLLLKKGNTDALWLKDIAVKIYAYDGKPVNQIIRFEEFHSLTISDKKIDWDTPSKDKRNYTIAPGEIFRFGKIEAVPSGIPLIIEAAVFGKRAFWPKGFQWRASCTSLPVKKEK